MEKHSKRGTDAVNRSAPLITIEEFQQISEEKLPFAGILGLKLDEISTDRVVMRSLYNSEHLRPGGTISGPVMMGLADAAMYALVLSQIGPVELAVTTNLNINFLRKPEPADVIAVARMLKLGRRLAVGEVSLYSGEIDEDPVAHVTATYSIPPVRQ